VLTSKQKASVSAFVAIQRPPFTLLLSTMKLNPIKLSIVQYTTPIHTIYTIQFHTLRTYHYSTHTSTLSEPRNLSMRDEARKERKGARK
jgi:hypothetical protein